MNGLTQSVTVDRRARLLAFGALIAAALMLSLSAFSTSARAAESDPTIVLVHGAFASPAGWDGVADALHKDGYQTATPALGLASVSDDVAIVRSTLDSIPGDKILVGHSYGGFVITNAASGRSDVRGLVYTAAYVPDSGETINSLSVGYAPGAFLAHLVFAPSFPFVIVDPQFFPEGLRPGLESEAGRRDRSRAAPHEPGHLRHFIRPRRLARAPVVVRSFGPRPRHRPCPAAVHGPARWVDNRPVPRREPRGRPHPLPGAVREADRTSGSGDRNLIPAVGLHRPRLTPCMTRTPSSSRTRSTSSTTSAQPHSASNALIRAEASQPSKP
jgi:pimeloyl-ACP methyl ester carboxylesterase